MGGSCTDTAVDECTNEIVARVARYRFDKYAQRELRHIQPFNYRTNYNFHLLRYSLGGAQQRQHWQLTPLSQK